MEIRPESGLGGRWPIRWPLGLVWKGVPVFGHRASGCTRFWPFLIYFVSYEYSLYVLPVSSVSFQVQHPTDYRIRGMGVCLARKNSLWALTTSLRRVTSRATSFSCDGGEGEARFPHRERNVDPLRSTTLLRGMRSARSGEEFPLLCPKPKVMPRFSLGDVGEARWLLSHRWTDT